MARQRFTKWERKENRAKELVKNMAGEGTYIFENVNNADLTLPRATKSGQRKVGPKGRFQGDSYYMQMVRSHELRLIEVIQTPEAEREAMREQKLILDQPDRVTSEGTVEQVTIPAKNNKLRKLNDGTEVKEKQPEVLITEDPMSGVEIILE